MSGRLVGRRVLVFGAGQRPSREPDPPLGIGRACAVLAAREGARVACVDRSERNVLGTVERVRAEGGEAFYELADAADEAQVRAVVARSTERLGGLDGVVVNVGVSRGLSFDRLTTEVWDAEYAVNVRSHFLVCQEALPRLAEGASVVLMSSIAARRHGGRNPAYETSKAAVVALAGSVAVAGEPRGVRCNVVLPGFIDTPMGRDHGRHRPDRAVTVPFGRQGTAAEVAAAVVFLLSADASYVNAHALVVDGGLSAGVGQ